MAKNLELVKIEEGRKGVIENGVLYEITLGGPPRKVGRVDEDGIIYQPVLGGKEPRIIGRIRTQPRKACLY